MEGGERSEAGCVQLQGGGLRHGGAMVIDDNAADARAQPRDAALHVPLRPTPRKAYRRRDDVGSTGLP
ncbi:hypothetical protein DBP21_08715 [Streptomyces sp. CS147]|nr:hypothetical protein DBP21_08715 [Streptomyces sp. CS147]